MQLLCYLGLFGLRSTMCNSDTHLTPRWQPYIISGKLIYSILLSYILNMYFCVLIWLICNCAFRAYWFRMTTNGKSNTCITPPPFCYVCKAKLKIDFVNVVLTIVLFKTRSTHVCVSKDYNNKKQKTMLNSTFLRIYLFNITNDYIYTFLTMILKKLKKKLTADYF